MSDLFSYEFANPDWLWGLLLLLPVGFGVFYITERQRIRFQLPSLSWMKNERSFGWPFWIPFTLRILAFSALIIALARPQESNDNVVRQQTTEGIDIVMAMDISGSMLAEDFKPNRLEVAREVALEFIEQRSFDRIGLVVYEGEAFTQCPLTTDHNVLKNLFSEVKSGMISDGTAIGMGLATAVNRLREADGKSRVVILLTDGVNNRGNIDPITASEIAKEYGVRVYTIGVGKNGTAPFPMKDPFGRTIYQQMPVEIDEDVLTQIAENTGGKYFRATNKEKLEAIYREIDQMEKAKVRVTEFKSDPPERFHAFAWLAIILLSSEIALRKTILRSLS